ncbi:MAG: penicillin-binding protein 2, partial [Desulfovibrio sp.]|nr:penicillin-binding protein 2 [Desulfovibrio sp.]
MLSRRAAVRRPPDKGQAASNNGPSPDWNRIRLWTVALVFSLLWAVLWGRAYYLQIVKGPEYAAMAKRQHIATEFVRGVRGNILDRNGNVIARSVECSSVWANPDLIRDREESAARLSGVLDIPADRLARLLKGDKRFVWLKRKVDFHTAEKVKDLKLAGVYLDTETERVYPYRHLAGQLLGFVDIDDKGIEGLEKAFEEELTGREVTRVVGRDASGRRLITSGSGTLTDLRGRDVRLTIDTQVQFFAEEALAENVEKFGARWGGCLVVDVPTGEILAWAQYPFFDPNNVGATPPPDRRNRLAMDRLEQGSTIKSFLIAAALEERLVEPSTLIHCENGKWKLGRHTLHDTHPYSRLTVEKILHVSSNIGAAKIGIMLGAERYYNYLRRLGFGQATGLPLAGEATGILRPASKWAEIDLANAAFGQSFSATLAQMAKAYLCLASDGVKRDLTLVMDDGKECRVGEPASPDHQRAGENGETIFSAATMRKVRAMLREVVEEQGGTGKQARIPGLVVGGKTGTAQKADAK